MPHECDSDRRRTVLGATFAPLKEDALSVRAARALEATTRGARTAEGAMMAAIFACIEHGLVRARCRSKTGNKKPRIGGDICDSQRPTAATVDTRFALHGAFSQSTSTKSRRTAPRRSRSWFNFFESRRSRFWLGRAHLPLERGARSAPRHGRSRVRGRLHVGDARDGIGGGGDGDGGGDDARADALRGERGRRRRPVRDEAESGRCRLARVRGAIDADGEGDPGGVGDAAE